MPHDRARTVVGDAEQLATPSTRRDFLRTLGLGGSLVLLPSVFACDDDITDIDEDAEPVTLDLSTDVGILNFAYALEQLEAAYYTQVTADFYDDASQDERAVLQDIRDHEVAHRDFLAAALGAGAIGALTPDFSAVDFDDRASVLGTAQTFEDLGVAAYNGAANALASAEYLTAAGKIVSVEARHASIIRTLLGRSFAPEAFDDAFEPPKVLTNADPYIENSIILLNA